MIETEKLKDDFPRPVLTKIFSGNTQETLRLLLAEMTAYSASITRSRGGGDHGYMILLMTPTKFATYSSTVFNVRINPVDNRKISRGSEAIEIIVLQRVHAKEVTEYKWFHRVDKVLKKNF